MKERQFYKREIPMVFLACPLLLALLFLPSETFANVSLKKNTNLMTPQDKNMRIIKGTVKDSSGDPFPGATILVKGTTLGVVSDANGNYSISVPSDPNTVLVISFVGMKTKEIKVGKATTLNVILEEESTALEQVVVNGVFERKANTFTGSVKTISKDELKRVGNSIVLQSLKNIDTSIKFLYKIDL